MCGVRVCTRNIPKRHFCVFSYSSSCSFFLLLLFFFRLQMIQIFISKKINSMEKNDNNNKIDSKQNEAHLFDAVICNVIYIYMFYFGLKFIVYCILHILITCIFISLLHIIFDLDVKKFSSFLLFSDDIFKPEKAQKDNIQF